jgi:hypothetical protein
VQVMTRLLMATELYGHHKDCRHLYMKALRNEH